MNRLAWIFRWACYRWYLTAPIQWRISCWALPYAIAIRQAAKEMEQ